MFAFTLTVWKFIKLKAMELIIYVKKHPTLGVLQAFEATPN
jgi:hypothetical protein